MRLRRSEVPAESLNALRKKKREAFWPVFLLGSIFTVVGLLVTAFASVSVWMRAAQIHQRIEVPAVVTSAEVRVSRSSDSTTYHPEIRFTYEWNEQSFTGDSWALVKSGGSSGWAREVVARYPAGSVQSAWVDPENPTDAILDPTIGGHFFLTFIPLIFVAAGLLVVGFAWRMRRGNRRPGAVRSGDSLADGRLREGKLLGLPDVADRQSGGEVVLRARQGAGTKVAGLIAFSVIWNGFAWFMFLLVRQQSDSGPAWFIGIFLVIGLIVGIVSLYQLAGVLFGPKITLVASPGVIEPGGSLTLRWRVRGSTARLYAGSVTLEGATEGYYTVGSGKNSRRVMDRYVFLKVPVFQQSEDAFPAVGEGLATVPSGLPPTFEAPNNHIRYTVQVAAKVRWLPNWEESYPVYVVPPATAAVTA